MHAATSTTTSTGFPSAPTAPALDVRDLWHRYSHGDNAVDALRGVSLRCPPGTWTAVMGPSGSGKSTLLHCAAGLEGPTSGRVVLAGHDLSSLDDDQLTELRRTTIGFVFQGYNLVQALTAEQNVTLPLRLAGRRIDGREARRVLTELGLGDRVRHRPRELSGGQQQRVAIARALVTRPAVLFADEPTGALDSHAAAGVLALLRRLVEAGQTVVMVTHDAMAAASADRVVFLRDGQLAGRVGGGDATLVAQRLGELERAA